MRTCGQITSGEIKTLVKKSKQMKPWGWKEKFGSSSAVYFYCLTRKPISYPFRKSKIVYMGKTKKDLAGRIWQHFSKDTEDKLLDDKKIKTSKWFYQNYCLAKIPFVIKWLKYDAEDVDDMERLFIGLFAAKYGAPPICNGSVQRDKLKKTYEEYKRKYPKTIKEIWRRLRDFSSKKAQTHRQGPH